MITHGKDGTWIAECDGCPDAKVNTGQRLFHQAVNYVRGAEGWKIRYIGDQWWAICPRCADIAHELTPDDLAILIFDDSAVGKRGSVAWHIQSDCSTISSGASGGSAAFATPTSWHA